MRHFAIFLLLLTGALTACNSDSKLSPTSIATLAPSPTESPAPTYAPTLTATPTEMPATTTTPVPTPDPAQPPAKDPTSGMTSTATPARPPATKPAPVLVATVTPEAPSTPTPNAEKEASVLSPLNLDLRDAEDINSELSGAELACLKESEPSLHLRWAFFLPGYGFQEERVKIIGCLEDETLARIFLADTAEGVANLSLDSSTCVRAAFNEIDPRSMMLAKVEGFPEDTLNSATTLHFVTMACLNDAEWEAADKSLREDSELRDWMQCIMEKLGGPGTMATAMTRGEKDDQKALADAAADCAGEMGPTSDQEDPGLQPAPTRTSAPATPTPKLATTLTIIVAEVPDDIPEYDRSEWEHWTDGDADCQDGRQEVLIAESLVEVAFETDRECRVATGQWYGAFTGAYVDDPRDLDIDHLVPLKNAHRSGGWRWPAEKKEEYANNLSDPDHLIAVTAGANRSKGARGPEEWAPPESDYWCQYATDWTEIKYRWLLTMTQRESEIVMDMLRTCDNPPEVDVLTGMVVRTGVHKPAAEPEGTIYGSCKEAEAAEEQRVQGSRGEGRGFPSEMVPSARDGDQDGVVCER